MKTYKYRLYPTKVQQDWMWWQATCLNRLYNYFLDYKIKAYEEAKINVSKADLDQMLTEIKHQHPDYYKIHSQVLQQASRRLDQTYQNFFKSGFGFPKFRSNRRFFGLLYPQNGYQIKTKTIIFSKIGEIKYKRHRDFTGEVRQVFITCDQHNHWYVSITVDQPIDKPVDTQTAIGIDLGISKFATLSDGQVYTKSRHTQYFNREIKKLQSWRDQQCKRGSRRYKFLSRVIRQLYGVKNRKINDTLHKVSHRLSSKYDTIVVEDLSSKKMSESKSTGLNREIREACWSRFVTLLEYKAQKLIKVNPYNTSKKCHNCGKIHNMPLQRRIMSCDCGVYMDRDHNAAINILCQGLAMSRTMTCTVI